MNRIVHIKSTHRIPTLGHLCVDKSRDFYRCGRGEYLIVHLSLYQESIHGTPCILTNDLEQLRRTKEHDALELLLLLI